MFRLIRLIFWVIVILIIFAIVPESFWLKIKPFFDWDKFVELIRTGFQKFFNLFNQLTGADFNQFLQNIKNLFSGIFNNIKGAID